MVAIPPLNQVLWCLVNEADIAQGRLSSEVAPASVAPKSLADQKSGGYFARAMPSASACIAVFVSFIAAFGWVRASAV
jgi:hypothetical protein